jgi:hypothetical protein
MFSNLLLKSIKIGEKAFHILCEVSLNVEEYEKLGIEIIKDASEIKKKLQEDAQKLQAEVQKPVEAAPEEPKPAE